jgi:gamma-glutamyltranspeptidase/glutathione hydrolase
VTARWLNYALSVIVVLGLVGVVLHERPRLAEERAAFLGQEVAAFDAPEPPDPEEREPLQLRLREQPDAGEQTPDLGSGEATVERSTDIGVSASHPLAVEVGMDILAAGGNAIDAAVAVAYALGVVEPFGSGVGGGGALVYARPGQDPLAYDYREIAPPSGGLPASDIGVPGFVAGMELVHDAHGTIELADLIEPAARHAEDGIEVDEYLHDRLVAAAPRLPIHLAPEFFPGGTPIGIGATLRQPAYAEALRLIQDEGAAVVYGGSLGERIADAVSGLELEDLEAYEVLELEPAEGTFGALRVIGGAAPVSSPTVIQMLQVLEQLGIRDLDIDTADGHHAVAQAWRVALADRTEFIGDPTVEDVPLTELLSAERADELAGLIPADGFADVEEQDERITIETDTTHVTIVDASGAMVSMTNTLSNFFGSGLPVSGFFLNDQLKNFSPEDDSVNVAAPGKRPRSFVAPMIVLEDDVPVLGIGSPGGRRIPMVVTQVLVRWANGQDLDDATEAPRFHLEGRRLELETAPSGDIQTLTERGYEVTTEVPTTEYFGGMQALQVLEDGTVTGIADARRDGAWDATAPSD